MHLTVTSGLEEITSFLQEENKFSYSEREKFSILLCVKAVSHRHYVPGKSVLCGLFFNRVLRIKNAKRRCGTLMGNVRGQFFQIISLISTFCCDPIFTFHVLYVLVADLETSSSIRDCNLTDWFLCELK